MKNIFYTLILILLSVHLGYAQSWMTDIAEAKEIASTEDKPIVMVFQGSDWCAPCIKLNREIWSTETFKDYAADHYVMVQVDFPRKKNNKLSDEQTESNAALAEEYNQQGFFPFVVMIDAQGNVLGETGYKKTTPKEFISELNAFAK